MTGYTFSMDVGDLNDEKFADLMDSVSSILLEKWEAAGLDLLENGSWDVQKPRTWQEAYARNLKWYTEEDILEYTDRWWEDDLKEMAEKEAYTKIWDSMAHLEFEVDI